MEAVKAFKRTTEASICPEGLPLRSRAKLPRAGLNLMGMPKVEMKGIKKEKDK